MCSEGRAALNGGTDCLPPHQLCHRLKGCTWGNVVFGESEGTRFGSLFRRHAPSIVVLAALHAQTQLHASNLYRRVVGCRGRDSAVVARFTEGFELLSAKQCEASLQAREERQRRARRLAWLKENLVESPTDEPGAWDDFALRAERQASEELGADGADEYQDAVSELGPSLAASRRPSREGGLSTAVDLGTFPVTPQAPSIAASRSRTPSLTPDEEAPLSLGSDVKSAPDEKRGGTPGGTPGSMARRAISRGAAALQLLRHRSLDSDSPLVYLLVGVYFAADFTVASSLLESLASRLSRLSMVSPLPLLPLSVSLSLPLPSLRDECMHQLGDRSCCLSPTALTER